MAYKDDDKTMAVIKFADEHPEGKLKWCEIAQWINTTDTKEKYPFAKRLSGIREYQFRRMITKNGKKKEQECKKRFDEINDMRKELSKKKLPLLATVRPEEFLELSYVQQMEAIREAQESYLEMNRVLNNSDQLIRSNQVDKKQIEQLCIRVDDLADEVKRTILRTKEQVDHMMRRLNEASIIQIMEQYEIPMNSMNIVKIMDELDDKFIKVYDIRDELNKFKNMQEIKQGEGGKATTEDVSEQNEDSMYWDMKNATLFD